MTLRRAILGLLLIALGAALAAGVYLHRCPGWAATPIWLAALIVAFLFERQRYAPSVSSGTGDWKVTGERFIDPVSGERLAVYVDPSTGDRDYRPIGEATAETR
jgi:hypothetical protein